MAAIDFPNAPTVGQVATLTNGFSYQWDGTVWILAGTAPGQQAGGDLTGTYPNPQLKPGVVPLTVQARVSSGGLQSIPNGAETILTFDSIATNVGGAYSAGAPNRFTIPTAGFYLVGASLQFAGGALTGSYRQLLLYFSSGVLTRAVVAPSASTALEVVTGAAFAVNEVLQVKAYQDNGAAVNTTAGTVAFWLARVA